MSWSTLGSTVRYTHTRTHLMMATNIQSKHQQQPNRTEKLTTGQMCIRTAVYFMHTISGGDGGDKSKGKRSIASTNRQWSNTNATTSERKNI